MTGKEYMKGFAAPFSTQQPVRYPPRLRFYLARGSEQKKPLSKIFREWDEDHAKWVREVMESQPEGSLIVPGDSEPSTTISTYYAPIRLVPGGIPNVPIYVIDHDNATRSGPIEIDAHTPPFTTDIIEVIVPEHHPTRVPKIEMIPKAVRTDVFAFTGVPPESYPPLYGKYGANFRLVVERRTLTTYRCTIISDIRTTVPPNGTQPIQQLLVEASSIYVEV